jgi:hypothetical protein
VNLNLVVKYPLLAELLATTNALVGLSGWAMFFHSTLDGVHHFTYFNLFWVVFFLDLTAQLTLLTFLFSQVLYQPWHLINYPLLT